MSEKKETIIEKKSTRRNFLKNSGLTVGGIVLGGAVGSLLGNDSKAVTEGQYEHTENHTYY